MNNIHLHHQEFLFYLKASNELTYNFQKVILTMIYLNLFEIILLLT
ncbi:unnamed protein product [Acanthoscelides obtectus]|uniref:Uncharacterized protein n=1 Tax=Acanthoscelides obtectus TaxID=200917 RepID=A0A9P0QAQ2_ACAOB|nr:unnamed protein product [Acanthoscelides obtectus]CAK1649138.1 hypothetical protein AOBTE_LOCUS16065 [Acanthoscelides obtectus]